MNLIEAFSCIEGSRRAEGKRYPFILLLIIIMMSILCGYCRYREIARFANANKKEFQHFFKLKKRVMPSHVTFRDILQRVNFEQMNNAFTKWARQYVSIEPGDWISVDGKAIGSTVSDYDKSYQNFVSLVSFFSQKHGQIVQVTRLENGKSSEIPAVQKMIEVFDLKDVIFTMDALHCQKKTLEIIVETGNDYLVKVKANQPTLLEALQQTVSQTTPLSSMQTEEKNRGRLEKRHVDVFSPSSTIPLPKEWTSVQRIISVRREFKYQEGG